MKKSVILVLLIMLGIFLVGANGNSSGNESNQSNGDVNVSVISIIDIIPHEAPMLVPVSFVVLVEGNVSDFNYEWDFGDGGLASGSDKTVHTYSQLGLYELSVRVFNSSGYSIEKVYISVVSPVGSVNKTINDFKKKLDGVEREIDKLPDWIGDEISSMIGLDELNRDIGEQENKTLDGISEQEAVDIVERLYELDVPERFGTSLIINKVSFFMDAGKIDLGVLGGMGAGSFKEDRSKYDEAIGNWVKDNLDLKVESSSYKVYYSDREEELASYVKVSLIPKKDLDKIYFVIDGEIVSKEGGTGILEDLNKDEEVKFEFLYPGKIGVGNVPVYVSPDESELDLDIVVGICDNDGICESGENYDNCPNDCKRLFSSSLMFIGLLVFALIIYIFLQEWYKRFYERHLFPDRNQLFNLVHFMNNSINQGMDRGRIFGKLKDAGWKGEQLNYGWRKLHGKRTGMWEIPVLKWWENKEVKKELERRGSKIGYREFRV